MLRHTPGLSRLLFTLAIALWALGGCGMEDTASDRARGYDDGDGDEDSEPPLSSGDSDMSAAEGETASHGSGQGGQAGVLTAGAWDDNRNFEHFMAYRDQMGAMQLDGAFNFSGAELDAAHQAFGGDRPPRATLDVALVIDTTGSMGDEITYLQAEFETLSSSIAQKFPNATQRWALVVYRDEGDEYVVRSVDFTADAADFRTQLAAQSASGGGDFPEAPEAAFGHLSQLAWREAAKTARLAFWVADAPHHAERAATMKAAVQAARDLDVHIYPVASSGIDELTEWTMRSTAQITGGRYLFLTDDSGVGGEHEEPTIPCYFVTRLDRAIVRMIDIELTGTYVEPAAADVIRTGGDPTDGACKLASGEMVEPF
jgi:hypothetical protein